MTLFVGWAARVFVVICAFVNTRLLIDIVGVNGYAALTILLSLAPWFALLNLGLPNTTQNLIAKIRATQRDPRRLRQAAVDAACTAAILYILPVLAVSVLIQNLLLPGHGSMSYASVLIVVFGLLMLGLATVFQQVLHAMHRSTWPLVTPAIQAVLTTMALFVVIQTGARGHWVAIAIAMPMFMVFLLSARLVGARLRPRIDWRALKILLRSSRHFLIFGFAGAVALSCDYIVMSRLLSSTEVTQYSLAAKSFGTVLTLHGVLLAAVWTPLSDKFYRGELLGMRTLLMRMLYLGIVLAVLVGLPLAFLMDEAVEVLTGGKMKSLPLALTVGWFAYIVVRIWSDTFATALLSCNQLGTMTSYLLWQSIISLLAQWVLGTYFGTTGIVLGILCSFLLTAAWILPLRFFQITRPVLADSEN